MDGVTFRRITGCPTRPGLSGKGIAEARQQSGAEKLKGHDIMGLERFDPEVKHMIVFDVLSWRFPCR